MNANRDASAKKERNGRLRTLRRWLQFALILYAVVLGLLMLLENRLIYLGWGLTSGEWNPVAEFAFEETYFESADGTRIHGWYLEHPQPRAHVLYSHGNGINVAYLGPRLNEMREEKAVSIFVYDYRGFGRSEGKPHEAGVLADGDAAQRWLANRAGIELDDVVLMGRSLGGGVAVDLAARNGARGLVLERTFTSLPDVAARIYWWAPVRLLMRNRFDNLSAIAGYDGPLLQSHGTADEVVPFDIGKRLFDASPSVQKRFVKMPGVHHNDAASPEYEEAFSEFLDSLPDLDSPP